MSTKLYYKRKKFGKEHLLGVLIPYIGLGVRDIILSTRLPTCPDKNDWRSFTNYTTKKIAKHIPTKQKVKSLDLFQS